LTDSAGQSELSHRDPMRNLQTFAREGPHQGERMLGCPSVSKSAITPSITVEMKEEHKLGLEK
jgi:hypothetical protein